MTVTAVVIATVAVTVIVKVKVTVIVTGSDSNSNSYGERFSFFSLYIEKTVYIKTHKTAINRPVDHIGET